MDNAVNPTPRKAREKNRYPDRLKVNADALNRLNRWGTQISEQLVSVKLTRSDLVNFLILNHTEEFSALELESLAKRYFDRLKFAKWAYEELERALDRGEDVELEDIIKLKKSYISSKARSKKPKSDNLETTKKVEKSTEKQPLFNEKDSSKSLENDEE